MMVRSITRIALIRNSTCHPERWIVDGVGFYAGPMASETGSSVDRSRRDAAAPELEQAVGRLKSAMVDSRAIVTDGEEPTQQQLLELWWAGLAVTSIWEHGVCANCAKPLSAHYGVEGRQCTTGAVVTDMESGAVLGRASGRPGWFTPRKLGD